MNNTTKTAHTPGRVYLTPTIPVPHYKQSDSRNGGTQLIGYSCDLYDVVGTESYAHVFVSVDHGSGVLSACDEAEKRARLIAAAPELLEACKNASNLNPGWLEVIRAAIAKAEGCS